MLGKNGRVIAHFLHPRPARFNRNVIIFSVDNPLLFCYNKTVERKVLSMRNDYEVRAQKFIQELFPYLINCSACYEFEGAVLNFMIDHPRRKISFDHGMTRVAFMTSDYVVKIDYSEENIAKFGGGEKEIEFYEMAEREGFDYLFAKISRYEYQGMTFYIMPRIRGIEKHWDDAWWYMTQEESDWCTDHHLYDLHSKNYGWRNGKVCIIDYGAYD